MSKPHKTWIVWGTESTVADIASDEPDNAPIHCYEFDTEKELAAFLYGVSEASDWLDSSQFASEEEAAAYVKQCTGDYANEPTTGE